MIQALTGHNAEEEQVYWKSDSRLISATAAHIQTDAPLLSFDFAADIAAFAPHPEGGLVIILMQIIETGAPLLTPRLWRLWPTTGGLSPISNNVPSPGGGAFSYFSSS
jgi:hypothetical protein